MLGLKASGISVPLIAPVDVSSCGPAQSMYLMRGLASAMALQGGLVLLSAAQ